MSDTGIKAPGTAVSINDGGTGDWTSQQSGGTLQAAVAASDNIHAILNTVLKAGQSSRVLRATNFGASIPAGSTIVGIEIRIEHYTGDTLQISDSVVQLVQNSAGTTADRIGTNQASSQPWRAGTVTYGSPTSMWGTSLTAAQINASNFGVDLKVVAADTQGVNLDQITLQVYYTAGGGGDPGPVRVQARHSYWIR